MSTEYDPPVICSATGKVCHPSRRIAAENLRRVTANLDRNARDRKERGRLIVYRCESCALFHIGNNDPFEIKKHKAHRPRLRPPSIEDDAA